MEYVIYSIASFGLVCFGGLMSGLTVGLLSIDELDMEIKLTNGTEIEKKQARRVLNTTDNHHLLLVTLLLANAACMETLPILLNKMVSEILAVAISVTFVLVFGEVLPQAWCTGPNQIKIASNLCPLVRVIMFLLFPLSYPIAKLLDYCFGSHQKAKKLRNEDLKTLITLHHSFAKKKEERSFSGLVTGQINIIHGAIDLRQKVVRDCMIPIERVYTISNLIILDKRTLKAAVKQGYSRVPVFDGNDRDKIAGILLMKRLVLVEDGVTLKESGIRLREPIYVAPNLPMIELLAKFQGGKSHMAVVKEGVKMIGIITLEDLFEQIIKSEILDEDDYDRNKEKSVLLQKEKDKMRVRRPGGFKKKFSALHPLLELDETH
jgi:CBS domain containing-hemolysin-like protein